LGSSVIAQEVADTTIVAAPQSKYGIFAGYLPDSPEAGPQLALAWDVMSLTSVAAMG